MKRYLNLLLFRFKNRSTIMGKNISVSRNTSVGRNCRIGNFCRLSKDVALGDNVKVGEYSVLRNIHIGDNTMLECGIRITGTGKGKIKIGKECYIGINNVLDNSDDITIGNYVHIAGPSTGLWCHSSADMCMNGIPLNDKYRDKYRPTSPIIIENNVYIGCNCTIYPGVTIGHHSIVAPNSAVTKNVPPFTLSGGVPAREIKRINGAQKTH